MYFKLVTNTKNNTLASELHDKTTLKKSCTLETHQNVSLKIYLTFWLIRVVWKKIPSGWQLKLHFVEYWVFNKWLFYPVSQASLRNNVCQWSACPGIYRKKLTLKLNYETIFVLFGNIAGIWFWSVLLQKRFHWCMRALRQVILFYYYRIVKNWTVLLHFWATALLLLKKVENIMVTKVTCQGPNCFCRYLILGRKIYKTRVHAARKSPE